ncbi:HAD family hydrolase [Butyricicoccus sp.]|uniref:HAD family hydrolase n=1 Tax=Butyricicoccus sp. TaxID=2049021 RepID=UPI003F16448A
MKKGAIFDMDGLLFDTERIYRDIWSSPCPFVEKINPQVAEAVCGTSGAHLIEILFSYYPGVQAQAYVDWALDSVDALLQKEVPQMPGCEEILSFLKGNNVKIAVASSSRKELIERNLQITGLRDYFDVIVSGQEVVYGKPEPDIFLLAAQKLGLPPFDCYVFEDGINGARAGIAAGCATVMIPDLTQPTAELKQRCTGIYPSLLAAVQAMEQGKL